MLTIPRKQQPAPAPFEVITAIDINSLSLIFDEKNEWDPAFSTSNTVASFQLPFAFPIDITQIEVSPSQLKTAGLLADASL